MGHFDDELERERINDLLSKMWSGDMFTLTNAEIHNIIKNTMWQTFLVDTYNISVNTNFSTGTVKIVIDGEMLMDMANVIKGIEILEDDDMDVDGEGIEFIFYEDDEDDDEEDDD